MAENRRYALGNQLDIEQILLEAQTRWLRPAEICEILRNHSKFRIAPEPPNKPPSGSLFLFDRKVLRYFRKDGHSWRKKKDGKTVKEAHERLKAGSIDVLHCYYAHGEENESFQRRSYWMLEEEYMHIVLVHYREVQGNKTNISRTKDAEEAVRSSQSGSPMSSSFLTSQNQVHSRTTDSTSLNSALGSEYEEAESANNYQASSTYHSLPEFQQYEDRHMSGEMDYGHFNPSMLSVPTNQYNYQGQQPDITEQNLMLRARNSGVEDSTDSGLGFNYETRKPLDLASWGTVLEHCKAESYGSPFVPSASSIQSATMTYIPRQEGGMFGQHFTDESINMDDVDRMQLQEKLKMDQHMRTALACDQNKRFVQQKAQYPDLHHMPQSFLDHLEQQIGNPVQDGHQMELPDVNLGSLLKSEVENFSNIAGVVSGSSDAKYSQMDNSKTEGLKKLDSFTRWMDNELEEVDESHSKPSSSINWDTVENENLVDDSGLSPQVHMDAYLLSTVLSQEQLFSIIDFSPSWAYTASETKVLITGVFLKNQEDVAKFKWSCMFGEVEVPVEVLADGVLRCIAPSHKAGRVPFYVTCSNRLACSEVREFEFRAKFPQDIDMEDLRSGGTNDILFHLRLGKLLSLGSVVQPASVGERSIISSKISSLMKEDEDEWLRMVKLTSEKEFSPGKVKDQLLQGILKEKLHAWLLQKVTEDGKGPSVLDDEGQGVIHLAAALGYDWAIAPTVVAGVSVNFRDINGWTALHWAAFCGRERTVVALLQQGAAPGALTDPSPKFPEGRTPADLASSNGHKGIAGFLAETSLTTHLSALDVKDAKGGGVPESSGEKAIQSVSERTATPVIDGNVPDVSLKDSLTAVCNATQAAARIHQVFRVQSFQKKKLVEYGDEKFGMSDEQALSLISVKTHRQGSHDEPVHTAAIRIQNKFRSWKGRKEFLLIRQRIVKLQAHVRGHQVRKHYKKIIWSVGIVEKAILRWRRKGSGLRGFRTDTHLEVSNFQNGTSKQDDYDFLKEGRRQTEERLQKALARVKSMVQYPEARDQYRRLLTVVTEFQTKAASDEILSNLGEAGDGDDDLVNLEALLDDDTFMSTAC